ncbi:response regulator transcription factor [Bradyrhizobium sp. 1]|uniref:LuxR C-terminal-related transcriptional regulator n=1 Tax=Bradyrhizobium sp. 1 TaxID=241591 RepID=UPI001FF7D04B|nr:response regulator transcription factor [Bradyrhizobium sp. 1]MCK1393755.1 response regulator [Bradyrhizobium sp. 1]
MLDASARQGTFKPIRVVIVDPQPIVLQGLRSVLGTQPDFDVVASSSDRASCLQAIRNLTPDVALLADKVPNLTVSEILAVVKAEKLSTRVVFFTESDSDHDLTAAIAAGACSAISKYASPVTMLRSLRLMAKNGVSLKQSDLSPSGKEADGDGKVENMLELLTDRERQIARLVSEGMSNKEIARQLNVSHGTVKVHLYNIFQKLEITNRTVLATIALLQRPSGFGTLSLAFLALAIADELKASEANDVFPDENGVGHVDEHAGYEPWKKGILRHLVVWESGETPTLAQRDLFAKAAQITNPAAAMEALRMAEQSGGSKPWTHYASAGSSAPDFPARLLREAIDIQIGDDPAREHQFPRLLTNAMSMHGGYGNFAILAGALIYALQDPHLAVHAHELREASIDSVLAITEENATTKLAAITHAAANHVDNSGPAFLSHDVRPSSAVVAIGHDDVAQEGTLVQNGAGDEGDNFHKHVGADLGHEASIGIAGNAGTVVDRSPIDPRSSDSKSTSSDSVFDFASGLGRINLAAFGALAWLHMTAATKSIPPHTLAWVYNSATNETIVYVNPTDRVLDVGDRGVVEIHLEGIVSIAEADVVSDPHGAVVATTLEQLEAALISAAATDETVLSTDNIRAIGDEGESTIGTAGVWTVLDDDGLGFRFGHSRTGLGASTSSRTSTSDSTDAAEESAGASGEPAKISSIALAHSAAVPAAENLTTNVEPGVAAADSAGHGNSQHASEPGPAKAATEMAEANSKPDHGAGHDNEHHSPASDGSPGSASTAEPSGAEHGKSGHSSSAKAAGAAESVEAADKTNHGNSQHASEPGPAKAATDTAEANSKPGHGVSHDNEHHSPASHDSPESASTAEPSGAEHGKSGHSSSAKASGSGESVEAADKTNHGNSQHAAEPGPAKAPTAMAEANSKPGHGVGHDNEPHSPASDGSPESASAAEPTGAEHGKSGHSSSAKAAGAAESVETADETNHGNSQHASQPESAKAAAAEPGETGFTPGNHGADHAAATNAESASAAVQTAELGVAQHGKSGHDLPSDAANPVKAAPDTGGAHRELVFHFDSGTTPSPLIAVVEPTDLHDPHGLHLPPGQDADLYASVKTPPDAVDEHAANHGNHATHHAIVPAPHDLLI